MKFLYSSLSLACALSSLPGALGATYKRTDNIVGNGFYDAFEFQAIKDPTHGRVNYVDQATARAQNLSFASADTFIMRADSSKTLQSNGAGRDSVRIRSKKTFTTHTAVFDVRHMPQGCGTWPAIWETKEDTWPVDGEIDILEGANDQGPNEVTMHTGHNCKVPKSRNMTGVPNQLNCDDTKDDNGGCDVDFAENDSYGLPFNKNGGGWYAMERNNDFIKVWYWARNNPSVPREVSSGASSINTDGWGQPDALFPSSDQCKIGDHFGQNNIIINLTFCGDWAGETFKDAGCGSGKCEDFVNNNPGAFKDAYFELAAVRVYQ
ncbi:nucleophile-disabled Lam16a mutant holds Laminariheptaose in A cyclical conformation [Pluteus cervinus]|uniref:Nucleophile-disabled Lam16a mutant holds Laminariheptaose in A cyclical conformation n=1 Tax=Pluteus cervinus TaxID=181527 RepID=A0ACD3AEH1_9AGAR|nr:nucleophile-disabled Lam16a mutant holds Laminariheptaose in A cyclical conformation [Pluteus cervinus]